MELRVDPAGEEPAAALGTSPPPRPSPARMGFLGPGRVRKKATACAGPAAVATDGAEGPTATAPLPPLGADDKDAAAARNGADRDRPTPLTLAAGCDGLGRGRVAATERPKADRAEGEGALNPILEERPCPGSERRGVGAP